MPRGESRGISPWVFALVLAIPVALVLAYGAFTTSSSVSAVASIHGARAPDARPRAASDPELPADIEQMVARLAKRLETQPDDANGWSTLAHSYYVLKRFSEAASAYERLVKISTPGADTFADYADALAMVQGRRLSGKPLELVHKALEIDPTHWKALSMAATESFDRSDYRAAIDYWQKALQSVPPGGDTARMLEQSLAQARQLSGAKR